MIEIISKYLEKVGASSIEELTDEQVEYFFSDEHKGTPLEWAYLTTRSAIRDGAFTREQVIKSMRKSMENKVILDCGYIVNESAFGYICGKYGWQMTPTPD